MKQSPVADLSAHFRVKRCSIENDIFELIRFFARQNGFDHRLRREKIVSKKLRRSDLQVALFNADRLLLLRFARALTLFLPSTFRNRNVDSEPALARHQLREIERKAIGRRKV